MSIGLSLSLSLARSLQSYHLVIISECEWIEPSHTHRTRDNYTKMWRNFPFFFYIGRLLNSPQPFLNIF
jgi:hypothetical protein